MKQFSSTTIGVRHVSGVAALLLILALPSVAQVAASGAQGTLGPGGTGTLVVTVRGERGTALPSLVTVNVYTPSSQHAGTATINNSSARFPDLLLGTYVVEAICPGFETAREEIELRVKNDQQQVFLTLRPLSGNSSTSTMSGPPLLAPKVQKELSKALEEIRVQRYDDARKKLAAAQKSAPNHPDVNYLLGLLESLTGNSSAAQAYWQKVIVFDPNHYFALLALGEVALGNNSLQPAKALFDRAISANPSAWRPHELLAHVYLRQELFEQARKNAEQAIDLGKGEANSARLVLAKAFIGENDRVRAISTLQIFLQNKNTDAQAASARNLLEALNKQTVEDSGSGTPKTISATVPEVPLEAPAAPAALLLPPTAKWMPPSIDDYVPSVDDAASCNLPAVLEGAEKSVLEFVKSLDSFTATELLQHQVINKQGLAVSNVDRKYNYLVSIKEVRPGILDVEEYRNATLALDVFPDGLATRGMPSVVLVFHPVNINGYEMKCEGLGSWHGTPAWQIHFQQKDNRTDLIRVYWVQGKAYHVPLKGRAWIAVGNFQVIRIETDLRQPLPDLKLLAEHQAIDYGPVRFRSRDVTLWLPSNTDLYLDFRGRRIHRRHTFENYMLFSVDDKQKVSKPPEAAPSNPN
ncbi:MAG TPA: tetratricopeptide repeat protein [Candidatus Sulfotelmatobacter sp.]|nr:tetratricopeptide repeat protein [Candidatus Sulfotelmatobacter sp.]